MGLFDYSNYGNVATALLNSQDIETINAVNKYYYKGNKMKTLLMESTKDLSVSYSIIDLDKENRRIRKAVYCF